MRCPIYLENIDWFRCLFLQVLAIIKELDWLRSARQEQLQVPSGCLQYVTMMFLSKKSREHRQGFIQALDNHRNVVQVEHSDSSVTFQIGTIQVDRFVRPTFPCHNVYLWCFIRKGVRVVLQQHL